jgi:hypothetical protein
MVKECRKLFSAFLCRKKRDKKSLGIDCGTFANWAFWLRCCQCFDNFLTTFWQLFYFFSTLWDQKLWQFWQLFDNFLTTFFTIFCQLFDNFLTSFDIFWKTFRQLFDNFFLRQSCRCLSLAPSQLVTELFGSCCIRIVTRCDEVASSLQMPSIHHNN